MLGGGDHLSRVYAEGRLITKDEEAALAKVVMRAMAIDDAVKSLKVNRDAEAPPLMEQDLLEATGMAAADRERVVREGYDARRALLRANMRFVLKIVHEETHGRVQQGVLYDKEDLMHEGLLALARAVERFNPARGRLATYAQPWIRMHVRQVLLDFRSPVKVKNAGRQKLRRVHQAIEELEREFDSGAREGRGRTAAAKGPAPSPYPVQRSAAGPPAEAAPKPRTKAVRAFLPRPKEGEVPPPRLLSTKMKKGATKEGAEVAEGAGAAAAAAAAAEGKEKGAAERPDGAAARKRAAVEAVRKGVRQLQIENARREAMEREEMKVAAANADMMHRSRFEAGDFKAAESEVARRAGLKDLDVEQILAASRTALSWESANGKDLAPAESAAAEGSNLARLRELLAVTLTPRQVQVISATMGMDGNAPQSLKDFAANSGVNYNTLCSDKFKAFKTLRQNPEVQELLFEIVALKEESGVSRDHILG